MNKVHNINLGGYPFVIDTDAYERLAKYLNTIQDHFRQSDGYEEIVSDIETRMAELFQERLERRQIVVLRDVDAAINIMGTPEEFGAEPMEDNGYESQYSHTTESAKEAAGSYKTGKRLFRSSEDQLVGGVASGIAAYFGIEDPLWIRLALVLFTISGGFGIPLYILLWIIVPEAKNAGDRLAMRGEKINVSNIGRIVEEEALNFTEKVSDWGEKINEKYGDGKKNTSFNREETKAFLRKGIGWIGAIFAAVIQFIRNFGRPLLFFIACAILFAFAVSWIASLIGLFMAQPFINYLTPDTMSLSYVGAFNFMSLLSIPLAAIALFISRLAFKTRVHSGIKAGMWVFWTISLFSLLSIIGVTAREFTAGTTVEQRQQISDIDHLTIRVDDSSQDFASVHLGPLKLAGKDLINHNVSIEIEKSDSDQFEIITERSAMGNSLAQANELASDINYDFSLQAGVLNFSPNFPIQRGKKWRNQEVNLIVRVPQGKKLTIADQATARRVYHYPKQDRHFRRSLVNDWIMGERGLDCMDCKQEKEEEGVYGYKDFNQLEINGLMKVMVEQGDHFHVRVDGRDSYRRTVEFTQADNQLSISTHLTETSSPLRLYVTMPHLNAIRTTNTDDVKLAGFQEENLSIENNGRYDILAQVDVDSISVIQHGKNEIDLRGVGRYLKANLSERARLDAERFATKVADVTALDESKIKIAVSDTLYQHISDKSSITTDNQPFIISHNLNN